MDGTQFDALLKHLSTAHSRRTAIVGLLGGGLGLLSLTETDAKHHKKKHKHQRKRGGGSPPASPPPACVPEPPAQTCAGRCGTQTNTCGQALACACPAEQTCLANGSCAMVCLNNSQCPAPCECNGPSVEGEFHCVHLSDTCSLLRSCTATGGPNGCPAGFHCQGCFDLGTGDLTQRCVQLCTG